MKAKNIYIVKGCLLEKTKLVKEKKNSFVVIDSRTKQYEIPKLNITDGKITTKNKDEAIAFLKQQLSKFEMFHTQEITKINHQFTASLRALNESKED